MISCGVHYAYSCWTLFRRKWMFHHWKLVGENCSKPSLRIRREHFQLQYIVGWWHKNLLKEQQQRPQKPYIIFHKPKQSIQKRKKSKRGKKLCSCNIEVKNTYCNSFGSGKVSAANRLNSPSISPNNSMEACTRN